MSKIISSILIIVILSQVICKDPWKCDSAGKYTCAQSQTCCRNKVSGTGWACFPTVNGVCCSDGISVCPQNTVCNLREKKCDPKPLTFLQDVDSQNLLPPFEPELTLKSSSAEDFALGFLDGFALFKNLPHQADCKPNDPAVVQDIIDIANLVRNITIHSDFKEIFNVIVDRATDAYTRISKISEGCSAYAEDIKAVINSLTKEVTSGGYAQKVVYHTMTNIGPIQEKAKNATTAFASDNYEVSGFYFGELAKYIFFWDVEPKTSQYTIFLEDTAVTSFEPKDALVFLAGFNQGFSFFNNLPHQAVCKLDDPTVAQDVLDIVDLISNIHAVTDVPKAISEIVAKVEEVITKVSQISDACSAFGKELQAVTDQLVSHVKTPIFYPQLAFHVFSSINDIKTKYENGVNSFKAGAYQEAGNAFGDLIKFTLFWNFTPKTQ